MTSVVIVNALTWSIVVKVPRVIEFFLSFNLLTSQHILALTEILSYEMFGHGCKCFDRDVDYSMDRDKV